jgi:hypothetical protein
MIHKISHFRVYAALSYTTNQLWSMRETIPSFPFYDISELVELSKQSINNDWERKIEASTTYNIRIRIGNVIKDIGSRSIPFICESDLRK